MLLALTILLLAARPLRLASRVLLAPTIPHLVKPLANRAILARTIHSLVAPTRPLASRVLLVPTTLQLVARRLQLVESVLPCTLTHLPALHHARPRALRGHSLLRVLHASIAVEVATHPLADFHFAHCVLQALMLPKQLSHRAPFAL